MIPASRYHSYSDLAENETGGFRIEWYLRISSVLVMTPHGGGIEPGTSEIVRALAGQDFSWYCFEGTSPDGNEHLHVTSTRFNEPVLAGMLDQSHIVLAVHGCRSSRKIIFVGGRQNAWAERFIEGFRRAGFASEQGEYNISGISTRNICNRGINRMGVQIELTEGLRRELFTGLTASGRRQATPLFHRMIRAGRQTLNEINRELRQPAG